jgi:hypothetical protein
MRFRAARKAVDENEGPLARPFAVLSCGNNDFAVLDGDAQLWPGLESGAFCSALEKAVFIA